MSQDVAILLHGAAGDSRDLHILARTLQERNLVQVYGCDMRGHGATGHSPGRSVAYPQQMFDDVVDIFAQIRRRHRDGRIIIGGHSAGGGLVLRLAKSVIAREFAGYLLIAPFLGPTAPMSRSDIGGWVRPRLTLIKGLIALNLIGVTWFNGISVIDFNPAFTQGGPEDGLSWSLNTLLAFGSEDWRKELAAVHHETPMLIVAGDEDECVLPATYATYMVPIHPGIDVTVLPNLGHWDILAAHSAIERIAHWLQGIVGDTEPGGLSHVANAGC